MSTSASNSTLTGLPSWFSMPSFVLPTHSSTPDALMAIAVESPSRALHRIDDREDDADDDEHDVFLDSSGQYRKHSRQIPAAQPGSYHKILEDLDSLNQSLSASSSVPLGASLINPLGDSKIHRLRLETEPEVVNVRPEIRGDSQPSTPSRKEDSARRHKRFSFPAVAIQTTPVTACPTGDGRKKVSLLPGGRPGTGGQAQHEIHGEHQSSGRDGLSHGMAAIKLSELLGRR